MKNFIKNNWTYILWTATYMLICFGILGGTAQAFFMTAIAYAISISLALSPVGEWILRVLENVRKPVTQQETEYLEEIFEEVYENAKIEDLRLRDDIQIFVTDAMYVNAFAVGKKTIAVTRGAIETFSSEELRGVLAHEFGHIAHGDTIALLLNVVGNGLFSIMIVGVRIVIWFLQLLISPFEENFVFFIVFQYLRFMMEIFIMAFMLLGQIILSLNGRRNEYNADKFASDIGYNEELTSALYILQKISLPARIPLLERIRASHPNTANRIARLENMQFE